MKQTLVTVVKWLGQNQSFIEATRTEIGQELLKDWLNDMDRLLYKIIEETATQEELAEFRVLKRIVTGTIIQRVNDYNKKYTEYKKEIEHE